MSGTSQDNPQMPTAQSNLLLMDFLNHAIMDSRLAPLSFFFHDGNIPWLQEQRLTLDDLSRLRKEIRARRIGI